MNIKGSPTSLELFGLKDTGNTGNSPDLFEKSANSPATVKQQYTTPNKKRPCFRSPKFSSGNSSDGNRNDLVSPLSAAISNSVQGVYCSQEIKDQDSNLRGEVWSTLKTLRDNTDVLQPYNIRNILQGKCLYKGKVAHISAIVKSVESVSQKDTSIVLHDNTGEIKAAVHSKVMEKHGALLEPGVGLLLRQCTVFSFISVQKYVNITLPNIVHVYNSSSLRPAQEIIDRHVAEVSEINAQKVENPDTENQAPNITINTPNRPPPPRPSRNVSRTNTPQNNSRTNTPQNNSRGTAPQNKTNSYTAPHNFNKTSAPSKHTPQKTWTPQRNRFPQKNSAPEPTGQTPQRSWGGQTPQSGNPQTPQRGNQAKSNSTPPRHPVYGNKVSEGGNRAGPSTSDVGNKKRESGESGVAANKRIKTTPPPSEMRSTKNSNISPKEQEEIAKLLEDIDDSFFDEF